MRKVGHRKQDPVETEDTGVGQREVEEEGRDKLKCRKENARKNTLIIILARQNSAYGFICITNKKYGDFCWVNPTMRSRIDGMGPGQAGHALWSETAWVLLNRQLSPEM